MTKKERIKKLEETYEHRIKALEATVLYEDEMLKKVGKRKLEGIRDEILDLMLELRMQRQILLNAIKENENE
jgi:hypothetical protein